MKNTPIIVVCGMNHSGTSCVAKFLIDHGADPGLYDSTIEPRTPYIKYENTLFKNCCIHMCNFRGLVAPDNSLALFLAYINKRKNHSPLLLKYPKSVFCLNRIMGIIGKERMRTVFVLRNTMDAVESNARKTGVPKQQLLKYYYQTYNALLAFEGRVLITAFERIREGLDTDILLTYCGLTRTAQ